MAYQLHWDEQFQLTINFSETPHNKKNIFSNFPYKMGVLMCEFWGVFQET